MKFVRHWARRAVLFGFKRLNPGDITVRHSLTGDRMRLHSFRHRQYWVHGRSRESATMAMFKRLIRSGDVVYDVGGHIGFISLYFAQLAGANSSIIVFEPGENNLRYLRHNVVNKASIRVVPKALGEVSGKGVLYLEDLTGQNNSLIPDYELLHLNEHNAVRAEVVAQEIEVVSLDEFVSQGGPVPDFVKIDVEGFELEALMGSLRTLDYHQPALMVEVTRLPADVYRILHDRGYQLFGADGVAAKRSGDLGTDGIGLNAFALHRERHRDILLSLALR